MHGFEPTRRLILAALTLPVLSGCAAPLPEMANPASAPEAQALLAASAEAHGLAALGQVSDISVSYSGKWRALVGRLQPVLVDAGFRGRSEERLLLRERLVAQAHNGPSGVKQVLRRGVPGAQGQVRVWFNGTETSERDPRAAAGLVADGYSLFLLGPMLLARRVAEGGRDDGTGRGRAGDGWRGGSTTATCCGCVLRRAWGCRDGDRLAVYIDRTERLMRRVRFTLDGLEGTRGAVAEVDTFDHMAHAGVRWPTGFYERLLRPVPIGVHDWRMTGLDLNRDLDAAEVSGVALTGKAALPAAALS